MQRNLIFLQLTQEFGGTKFGPFPGPEIRLGSEPSLNDITLPEALGVFREHVKILIQSDGSFIVAPVERTAAVHVFRGNQRPKHIATATALAPNDSFALVTSEGPRFVILVEEPKPKKKKKSDDLKNMAPTKEGLWKELQRIGFAMFFRNRIGNMAMRAWTMVKTGTIFSPRIIIGALFLSTGWIVAAGAMIAGVFSMFNGWGKDEQIRELQGDVDACIGASDGGTPTIGRTTQQVLGDDEWAQTLDDERDITAAYKEELRAIFRNPERYRWITESTPNDFTRMVRASRDLPEGVARVLPFVAATTGSETQREWVFLDDAIPEPGCGRGPARLTLHQARNLGLFAFPNALVPTAGASDPEILREALREAPGIDGAQLAEVDSWPVTSVYLSSANSCAFPDEEGDQRTELSALESALEREFGSGRDLPGEGQSFWVLARLVKFHAQQLPGDTLADLDLSNDPPSIALGDVQVAEDLRGDVLSLAAKTMARAAALPCVAQLDPSKREAGAEVFGELPDYYDCAILQAMVRYEE